MLTRCLGYSGAIALILTAVALLATVPTWLPLAAAGAISPGQLARALILLAPTYLSGILPISTTIAVVHLYTRWNANHEITALRMSGLSNWALAVPGLGAASVAMLVTACISLYLLPVSFRGFEDLRYAARANLSLDLMRDGYPRQVARDLSISFRHRLDSGEVEGVTILDTRARSPFRSIIADRGRLLPPDPLNPERILVLTGGSYQPRQLQAEDSQTAISFQSLTVPIPTETVSMTRNWRGYFEEHIDRLFAPPAESRIDPAEHGARLAEGYRRALAPVLCVSYVAFVLGLLLNIDDRHGSPAAQVAILAVGLGVWHCLLVVMQVVLARSPGFAATYCLFAAAPGIVGVFVLARQPARSLDRLFDAVRCTLSEWRNQCPREATAWHRSGSIAPGSSRARLGFGDLSKVSNCPRPVPQSPFP